MAERGQTYGTPDERFTPPQQPYPYHELNEMIDAIPGGEHPFSVITLAKNLGKGLNLVGAHLSGQPKSTEELAAAAREIGIAGAATRFATTAGRVMKEGAGAAGNTLGIYGSFVSDKADGAVKKAFEQRKFIAEKMEKTEMPKKIWQDTGLVRGPDGNWLFEIDDSKAELALRGNVMMRLGKDDFPMKDLFKHDDLYKVYPELKDVPVKVVDAPADAGWAAQFHENTAEVHINRKIWKTMNESQKKEILAHELQHVIQSEAVNQGTRKGGLGANPEWAINTALNSIHIYYKDFKNMDIKSIRKQLVDDGMSVDEAETVVTSVRNATKIHRFMKNFLQKTGSRVDLDKVMQDMETFGFDFATALEANFAKNNEVGDAEHVTRYLADQIYRQDRGEVEANDVMDRLKLTKQERRQRYPWEVADPENFDIETLKDGMDSYVSHQFSKVSAPSTPVRANIPVETNLFKTMIEAGVPDSIRGREKGLMAAIKADDKIFVGREHSDALEASVDYLESRGWSPDEIENYLHINPDSMGFVEQKDYMNWIADDPMNDDG